MTVAAALRSSKTMKKKVQQLVLAKETLRALTPDQQTAIQAGKPSGTVTTTFDPDCFYTTPSFFQCP